MVSFLVLTILCILLASAAVFSFSWFKKTNPGLQLWWFRTPTSHALLHGAVAFLLLLVSPRNNFQEWYSQFAGALLIVTGFGFVAGTILASRLSKKRVPQNDEFGGLIFLIHLGGGIVGIYIFHEGFSQTQSHLFPLAVAFGYLIATGTKYIQRLHSNFVQAKDPHRRSD